MPPPPVAVPGATLAPANPVRQAPTVKEADHALCRRPDLARATARRAPDLEKVVTRAIKITDQDFMVLEGVRLEVGYVTRGAQIAACDAARRLAVETLQAERSQIDRQADAREERRRPWWWRW